MNNKIAYKLELLYVKHAPMIISLGFAINNILMYYKIYFLYTIGSCIFGMSLFSIIHLYISSKVYKFCRYHRMFIHYIAINYILNLYDYYIGIKLSNRELFLFNLIILVIFLFLILYYYLKSKKDGTCKYYKEALTTNCRGFRCR